MSSESALGRIARATASPSGKATKYEKLTRALYAEIERGTWPPGSRLPPDAALAQLLPVSLGTIQSALKKLETDGIVERRYRVGTFVRMAGVQDEELRDLNFVTGWKLEPAQVAMQVIDVTPATEPAGWWAESFAGEAEIVRVRRVCTIDDSFRVFVETYLPASRFGALLRTTPSEIGRTTMSRLLGKRFKAPTVRAEHSLRVSTGCEDVKPWLEVQPAAPVLEWRVHCFTYANSLTMVKRLVVPQVEAWARIVAG